MASKCLLLLKKVVTSVDAVISVTKNLDNIISLMCGNKKHIIVYNSSLLPVKNARILPNENKITLLHEGMMRFDRGLKLMLELFTDEYFRKNIKLKIIGGISGDEREYYDKKIREYNIDDSMIEFTGWVDYENLHEYLTGDIGIIFFGITFNAYYGMPNKLFNYINAGMPILSTRCAELSDLISYNRIGCVVERDLNSIKAGIKEIMRNYNFYLENIKQIQAAYNWSNDEQKLISLYDSLLSYNND
jgi:glycosyltransferase involved in cell wall biosynthesis